jgi:methylthioribose-1-phosphate isomerase
VGNKTNNLSCQQVYSQGINCNTNAELVSRYSDLSYFFEGTVTKVFIEAEYIFGNGSILAKEGALNIALMAKRYNLPVLAIGGSWLYNGWSAVNYEALEERYGSEALQKLDWIE